MARPLVVFDSWRGRFTDSPRAIFEELVRRDAPYRYVWVLGEGSEPPAGADAVRPNTREHAVALARARHLVSNDLLPLWYIKPPGASITQTWHGSPLKRIGLDVTEPTYPHPGRYRRHLRRNSRLWDRLLSQNRFSTPIFRRAFEYRGPILEVGYPRNDELAPLHGSPPPDTVLYAPTWRDSVKDDLRTRAEALGEDVRRLADDLGHGHTLLLRLHKHEADALRSVELPANVVDRSAHGHVNDVLAEAGALVTDYSSIMFDFAVTGRPIVLYTPDLEHYRDVERGFYFDPSADGPGPVVRQPGEVVPAVGAGVDEARYERFRRTFVPLDDGSAASRVVEAVFGAK